MTSEYRIRPAAPLEAEIIANHRRSMFADMGYSDATALDAMTVKFSPWLKPRMETSEYLAWFAIAPDQSVAAGLGLWLMDWPPHMVGPGARRGNILNVYTQPAHRRN